MQKPIPFQSRRPALHLMPPPPRQPETAETRRDRQLDLTRELTDLNMIAARDAAHTIETRDPDAPDDTAAADNPTLALARATRAVISVINIENRIAAGELAQPFTLEDPRGVGLRNLLHPLAKSEPDPLRRRALIKRINDRIDDALGTDLDDDLPLASIAMVIASENGLTLDLAKVHDDYLESPRDVAARTAATPGPDRGPNWSAVWRHEADNRDQR